MGVQTIPDHLIPARSSACLFVAICNLREAHARYVSQEPNDLRDIFRERRRAELEFAAQAREPTRIRLETPFAQSLSNV